MGRACITLLPQLDIGLLWPGSMQVSKVGVATLSSLPFFKAGKKQENICDTHSAIHDALCTNRSSLGHEKMNQHSLPSFQYIDIKAWKFTTVEISQYIFVLTN